MLEVIPSYKRDLKQYYAKRCISPLHCIFYSSHSYVYLRNKYLFLKQTVSYQLENQEILELGTLRFV